MFCGWNRKGSKKQMTGSGLCSVACIIPMKLFFRFVFNPYDWRHVIIETPRRECDFRGCCTCPHTAPVESTGSIWLPCSTLNTPSLDRHLENDTGLMAAFFTGPKFHEDMAIVTLITEGSLRDPCSKDCIYQSTIKYKGKDSTLLSPVERG